MYSGKSKVLPIWKCFYFINMAIFGDFVAIFVKKSCQKNFFFQNFFFFKFLEIAFFEHNLARFEENFFFENFKKFFLKISHFEKSVILDTIFDFWLALYTQTICLKSCYHVYSRNLYVACIPFAHQRIRKIQSAIRYPVYIH